MYLLAENSTHGVDRLKVANYVIFVDRVVNRDRDNFLYQQEVVGRIKRLGSIHGVIHVRHFKIQEERIEDVNRVRAVRACGLWLVRALIALHVLCRASNG